MHRTRPRRAVARLEAVGEDDRGAEALRLDAEPISMSRRGDCWDNAPVESFSATLKKELVAGETFYSRAQARREIVDYIDSFYNCWRSHSSLGYLSPVDFEEQVA